MPDNDWDDYVAGRNPNSASNAIPLVFEKLRSSGWMDDDPTGVVPPTDRRAECPLCTEEIEPMEGDTAGTPLWIDGVPRKVHLQCMLRSVMGGIGHLVAHDYWCTEHGDPDANLTYRQSAQLVATWIKVVGVMNTEPKEDNEMNEVERTKGLMNTDDAMVWAEEFCRIFNGQVITSEASDDEVDPDIMTTWFTEAMQTAIDMHERRTEITEQPQIGMVPEAQREAFVEGFEEGREPTDEADPTT